MNLSPIKARAGGKPILVGPKTPQTISSGDGPTRFSTGYVIFYQLKNPNAIQNRKLTIFSHFLVNAYYLIIITIILPPFPRF